jgi:hypothetical protein
MRTTKELRKLIEGAAKASGRSVAQEVELRLERSFWTGAQEIEHWGGKSTYALLRLFAEAASIIRRPREGWIEDPNNRIRFRAAVEKIMNEVTPKGKLTKPRDTLIEEGQGAASNVLEGGRARDMLRQPNKQRERKVLLPSGNWTPISGALVPPKKK